VCLLPAAVTYSPPFASATTAAAYSGKFSGNQPHHLNRNLRSGLSPKPHPKTIAHALSRAAFFSGDLLHAPPSKPRVTARPAAVQKLDGSNYESWAADIKLWVTGQGYKDHLTKKSNTVDKGEKPKWEQIDAQLCSVIKSTLHPDIKPIFRSHVTCESVWSQAKKLYTNDTQRLYGVCHKLMNIITPKKIEGSISTYLGKVHSALHDFNELLPPAASATAEQEKEREQRSTFFMLLALYGLPEEYSASRDQILGSVTIPDMLRHLLSFFEYLQSIHLSLLLPLHQVTPLPLRHLEITRIDTKEGHPTLNLVPIPSVRTTDQSRIIQTKPSPQGSPASYEDFLRWCQCNQGSGSTASVAHTGNSFVCLSQSSLGPWFLDSGASDHVTGNKGLFSSLSTSGFLP
ncbi:hypothetical protein L195_g042427, partial [Trifolium pratense]